ncbi:MAG: polyprenyl synthetase family protein [Chitinophagaceae bacterium]|nr:polyprenyl synthetase family protein [Chitinophagaceae bacterium]
MHSFKELVTDFGARFATRHFPAAPASLYEPAEYFLSWGGKRIRPVMCLMGNELFGDIQPDTYEVATAIELFHNFTLIHDDIMDQAPLRRGMETVHMKYGSNTALLTGDVMMIRAYEHLNTISGHYLSRIIQLFNKTAREVCEGQQLDIDFETMPDVSMDAYLQMIGLKTSVLLAASLEMGAIISGTSEGNCRHIYEFGKNLGIAFQVQDDYLDVFGDPEKFGKETGGDIRQNKKTFLLLHAMEVANADQKQQLQQLLQTEAPGKVQAVLQIFKACNADAWAVELKEKYLQTALHHLDEIAVLSSRKKPLLELAEFLVQREY